MKNVSKKSQRKYKETGKKAYSWIKGVGKEGKEKKSRNGRQRGHKL